VDELLPLEDPDGVADGIITEGNGVEEIAVSDGVCDVLSSVLAADVEIEVCPAVLDVLDVLLDVLIAEVRDCVD